MEKEKKKKINKHNLDIILLFSVPVFLFTAVILFKLIPGWLANPTYDFIYQSCGESYCSGSYYDEYYVDDSGKVSLRPLPGAELSFTEEDGLSNNVQAQVNSQLRGSTNLYNLYYVDVSENSWREISLEESQKYTLDKNSKSPEGYNLEYESSYSDFFPLLGGSSKRGHYLMNGSKKKEIDLPDRYYNEVDFLGWVTK